MATATSYRARSRALGPLALACVAALLAGCGGSSSNAGVAHIGTSTGSSAASAESGGSGAGGTQSKASGQKNLVKYARCMRSHGVASFPEPTEGHIEIKGSQRVGAGGSSSSSSGINPEGAAFQAADKTCRKLLPNGGGTPSPQQQAKAQEGALNFSRCMHSHGVPNFPTPKFSGGIVSLKVGGPGINPSSPQFQAAQKACNGKFGPGGKGGGAALSAGGGSGSGSGAVLAAP